jgi:hypothetical protein
MVFRHICNVIVVLDQRVSLFTTIESRFEATSKDFLILILKADENSIQSSFFFIIAPESIIFLSSRSIIGYFHLPPEAHSCIVP